LQITSCFHFLDRLEPESDEQTFAEIDVDDDGSVDFKVIHAFHYKTDFDEEDNFQEFYHRSETEIRVEVINSSFKFYTHQVNDTINNCYWQSGEVGDYDYSNISYTNNVNTECEEKYAKTVSSVESGTFIVCLEADDVIDTSLSTDSDIQTICIQEYYDEYDGGGFQHGETIRDYRFGLENWSAENYIVFKHIQSGVEKHGFLKFQLEHLDKFRWAVNLLALGLEK